MHIAKTFAAFAFAAALSAGAAQAQTEIKFGHVGEPGSLFDQSAQEFAKRANAKLGSKAKVTVYGSSQLGGDGELMKKLKLGTVDLALPSTVMSSQVPAFGVFEMPYLVKDRTHMAKIRDQVVNPTLVPIAEKSGYHIIAIWENGFRQITNSKHPIVKPDDLKGLKLRVPGGTWRVKMFKAYGANPSPLAFSEVFVAHIKVDGSKWQRRGSARRPSLTPSAASQVASTAWLIMRRLAGERLLASSFSAATPTATDHACKCV